MVRQIDKLIRGTYYDSIRSQESETSVQITYKRHAMTKTAINCLLLLCLLPFLVHCVATKKEIQSTNIRMHSIDNKVEDIDQQVEQLKQKTVKDVQSRQAFVSDRLDSQQADIDVIKGKLEENAHYNRLLREENKELETSLLKRFEELENGMNSRLDQLDQKIAQLNQQLAGTDNQIKQAEEGIKKINEERAKEAADRAMKAAEEARKAAKSAEEAKAKAKIIRSDGAVHISAEKHKIAVAETTEAGPSGPEPTDSQTDALYNAALASFKDKQFDQAYDRFAEYLSKHPNGSKAPNARFWMGECLYNKKEYELAILDYQKVIVDFPKHSKAAAALLKQGMAFEQLKDNTTARIVYQKILDDYPASEQAAAAKKQLAGLK